MNYSCDYDYEVEVKTVSYNDFLTEMDFPLNGKTVLKTFFFMSNAFENFINGYNDLLYISDLFSLPNCMILVYDIAFSFGINTLTINRPILYFDDVYFPSDKSINYRLIICVGILVILATLDFLL